MKLSLKKRFGAIHVRPGRILRVAHDHQVPIDSQAVNEPPQYLRTFEPGTKWVTATVGSIALEIVAVKTGVVMGYAYLSGPAIRLNLYRASAPPHWFSPGRVIIGSTLSLPGVLDDERASFSDIVAGFMQLKYRSGADVVVMEMEVESHASMMAAMDMMQQCYRHIPSAMTVMIDGEKEIGMFHFQPPRDACPWSCAAFQSDLLRSGDWDVVDPWAKKTTQQAS